MPSYVFRCVFCGHVTEVYWATKVKAATARPKTCHGCKAVGSMENVVVNGRGAVACPHSTYEPTTVDDCPICLRERVKVLEAAIEAAAGAPK